MTKFAIIGSSNYQSKRRLQRVLKDLKKREDVTVIGAGGSTFVDKMLKKYAQQFELDYIEYNPSYSGQNMYSAMPPNYFGKSYHYTQLLHRMGLIAENCDILLVLLENTSTKMDPQLQTAINKAKKLNKPLIFLT